MKRRVAALVLFLLLLIIGGVLVAPRWVLYPASSTASKYPGSSQVVEEKGREYLVDPKENGEPIFVPENEIARYSPDFYNLLEIPAQRKLYFATGRVIRWQEIEGSEEQYLILGHKSSEERYRVTGKTVVAVERVGIPWLNKPNRLEKLEPGRVEEITTARLARMVLPGDAVVVLPVWELPELSKKDEEGAYLVYTLIVRRGITL